MSYNPYTGTPRQEKERKEGRIIGGAATLTYALLLLLLLLLVTFSLDAPKEEAGLMINFGDMEQAAPGSDMAMSDEIAEARQVEQRTEPVVSEQESLTQDFEEAPAIKQPEKKRVEKPKEEQKVTPNPTPTTQPPAEKPREVNRKALFPGRTENSTATSDGTGEGEGNQGDLAGDPTGSYDGNGTGTGGAGVASLAGRSLAAALPRPAYSAKDSGKVVVEITVNQSGRVTSAAYRSVGSTTQNSTLVAAALAAARQARFNTDEAAAPSQRGTITYIFTMQ